MLSSMEVPLRAGEEWTDVLTVSMTRDKWAMVLASLVSEGHDLNDLLEKAKDAAQRGDFGAMMIGPQILESALLLQSATREITEQTYPDIAAMARKDAEERADA